MSKARKKLKKGKSHSYILKNNKRIEKNNEVLKNLKK